MSAASTSTSSAAAATAASPADAVSAFPQKQLPGQPPPPASSSAASEQNASGSQSPQPPQPPQVHKRTYQACIPCRQRKVRCDLGSVEAPHDPPCVRCRREFKECYFSATRRKSRSGSTPIAGRGRGGSMLARGGPPGRTPSETATTTGGETVYGTPESEASMTPGSSISYGGVRKRQRIDSLGSSREMPQEAAHLNYTYAPQQQQHHHVQQSERGYGAQQPSGASGQYEREQDAQTNTTASTLLKREVYNSHDALQLLFEAVGASTPVSSGVNGGGSSEGDRENKRRSSVLTDGDDHREDAEPQIIFPGDALEDQRHPGRGLNSSTMGPSPSARLRRNNNGIPGLSRTSPISPLAPKRLTPYQHGGPGEQLPKLPENGLLGRTSGGNSDRDAALARAIKAWNKSTFVKDGWFSAKEAIAYVEYFIEHLHPLSPMLPSPPPLSAHPDLLISEPFLLTTIITISSRYMRLPGPGGASRSYAIHDMLWKEVKRGFERLMWGGAPAPAPHFPGTESWTSNNAPPVHILRKRGLRTLGTIEALIILTEWHVRSLHFPMELGGDWWGIAIPDDEDETPSVKNNGGEKIGDMLEPARRSDRMSWMLLGNAWALSCELGVFDDAVGEEPNQQLFYKKCLGVRRKLAVYILQLASRLGWTPMIPPDVCKMEALVHLKNPTPPRWTTHEEMNEIVFDCWAELTLIMKKGSERLFPSRERTREIIQTGRYGELLHQCYPEMRDWKERFERLNLPAEMHYILTLEYEHVRLFINSLALQAVVSRCTDSNTLSNPRAPPSSSFAALMQIYSADVEFIKEVVDASRCVLTTVVEKMLPAGHLRHAPVRIYLRILSAAMFLLKTFALGAKEDDVAVSLSLMQHTTDALRAAAVDDVHLAVHFADLLETLTKRIQRRFVRMPRERGDTPNASTAPGSRINSSMDLKALLDSHSKDAPAAPVTNGTGAQHHYQMNGYSHASPHPSSTLPPTTTTTTSHSISLPFSSPPTPAFTAGTTPGPLSTSAAPHQHGQQQTADYFYSPNEPAFDDWLAIPIDPILDGFGGGDADVYQNPMGLGVGLGVEVGGFGVDLLDVLLGMGEQ